MFVNCLGYDAYLDTSECGDEITVRGEYLSIAKEYDFFGFLNNFGWKNSSWIEKKL